MSSDTTWVDNGSTYTKDVHCCKCAEAEDDREMAIALLDAACNVIGSMADVSPAARPDVFEAASSFLKIKFQNASMPRLPG